MSMIDMNLLSIAGMMVKGFVPKTGTLAERITETMRCVIENRREVLWMGNSDDEDLQFRASLAGCVLAVDEADKEVIFESLQPLTILNGLMQGMPMDISQMNSAPLPLLSLWHEAKLPRDDAKAVEQVCNTDPEMTVGEARKHLYAQVHERAHASDDDKPHRPLF